MSDVYQPCSVQDHGREAYIHQGGRVEYTRVDTSLPTIVGRALCASYSPLFQRMADSTRLMPHSLPKVGR